MATARLMSINELCGKEGKSEPKKFFIPSYQRGYRWDEDQILNLAKDLYYFKPKEIKDENGKEIRDENGDVLKDYYCLQPVIVKKHKDEAGNEVKGEWDVVDGQQRLTALWIFYTINQAHKILDGEASNLKKYKLTYEKNVNEEKNELEELLEKIDSFINELIEKGDNANFNQFSGKIRKEKSNKNNSNKINNIYFLKSFISIIDELRIQRDGEEINHRAIIYNNIFNGTKPANIKIIWYELEDGEDPIETFVNINANKIPLTNAELIKANLLYNIEKDQGDNEAERIAVQWEEIEKSLNNDKFWHYMIKEKDALQTRIDYLFKIYCARYELLKDKKEDDKYSVFNAVSEQFETKGAKKVWEEIQKIHDALKDWYEDYDFYHLIGLLIEVSNEDSANLISSLYIFYSEDKDNKNNTKTAFKEQLRTQLLEIFSNLKTGDGSSKKKNIPFSKDNIEIFLKNLDYNEDGTIIKKILLLYNIALLINGKNAYERFPFDLYDIQKWDIEHINPKTPSNDAEIIEFKTWLEGCSSLLDYINTKSANGINRKKLKDRIKEQLDNNNNKKISESDIIGIYKDMITFLGIEDMEKEVDTIGNLVLLDNGTNRSYHNAQFIGKRNKIIQIERNDYEDEEKESGKKRQISYDNKFIPLGTKWVFLKGYKNSKDLISWNSEDMEKYTENISKQIIEMFKGQSND